MKLAKIIIPCLLLNACLLGTSKNAKFYTMTPIPGPVVSENYNTSVGVNRIQLPKYMERPQIVTQRNNSAQVNISEFNRWVETPSILATRTLAADLSMLLPSAQIAQTHLKGGKFAQTVTLEIVRLNATLGEQVELTVWCTVKDNEGKVQSHQKFEYTVSIGKTYDELAQVYSQLLADVSRDIAMMLITQ